MEVRLGSRQEQDTVGKKAKSELESPPPANSIRRHYVRLVLGV
jgi:hypothetical protein